MPHNNFSGPKNSFEKFLTGRAAPFVTEEIKRLKSLCAAGEFLPDSDTVSRQLKLSFESICGRVSAALPAGGQSLLDDYIQFCRDQGRDQDRGQIREGFLSRYPSRLFQNDLSAELGYTIPTCELADVILGENLSVLEIGAGPGWVARSLAKYFNGASGLRYIAVDNHRETYNCTDLCVEKLDGISALKKYQDLLSTTSKSGRIAVLMCYPPIRSSDPKLSDDILMPTHALEMMRPGNLFIHVGATQTSHGAVLGTGSSELNRCLRRDFQINDLGWAIPLYQWPHGERPAVTVYIKTASAKVSNG
jgi:hypothetical protein